MRILNFFKKNKPLKKDIVKEIISLEDLNTFLKKEQELLKEIEINFFQEMKGKIENFNKDLQDSLISLVKIDVSSQKIEERAKILVKQSLNRYLEHVEILRVKINSLDKENIKEFIEKFNSVFSEFEKDSFKSYQRATYSIGKEIAEVNNCIVKFFKDSESLFLRNKENISKTEKISEIYSLLEIYKEIKKEQISLNLEQEKFVKELKELKENIEKISLDKKELQESKEYKKNKENREGVILIENKIKQDLIQLNSSIDWKKITHILHSEERKMALIKRLREIKSIELLSKEGEEIRDLLKSANISSEIFEKKQAEIKKKLEEYESLKSQIDFKPLDSLNNGLEVLNTRKEILSEESSKLEKRQEALENEIGQIKNKIQEKVKELGDYKLIWE